jgi:hypothetical protein
MEPLERTTRARARCKQPTRNSRVEQRQLGLCAGEQLGKRRERRGTRDRGMEEELWESQTAEAAEAVEVRQTPDLQTPGRRRRA